MPIFKNLKYVTHLFISFQENLIDIREDGILLANFL